MSAIVGSPVGVGEEEDLRRFCWSDTALLNVDKNVSKTRAAIFRSRIERMEFLLRALSRVYDDKYLRKECRFFPVRLLFPFHFEFQFSEHN